jgi:hypothetical protein
MKQFRHEAQLTLPGISLATPEPAPLRDGEALPLPDKLAIDLSRVGRILACNKNVATHLVRAKYLAAYRIGTSPWLVEYQSVVDLCDGLRVRYGIRDRRQPKQRNGRWRDDDLLPFPIRDTITVEAVAAALERSQYSVIKLLEAGAFDAYKLPTSRNWRISQTAFSKYIQRLRASFEASRQSAREKLPAVI